MQYFNLKLSHVECCWFNLQFVKFLNLMQNHKLNKLKKPI